MRKMPGIIFGFVFCFSIFAQVDVNFDKKMEEYKANLEKFKTELKSPDSFIRQDACMALGVAGDTSALPSIRELLEDPDENVRAAAISSLSLWQDKPSITNIIILGLKDKFGVVRASAASSLAILGEKKCIPALRVLMQSDKDSMVKAAAAVSLNSFGDSSGLETVRALTKDRNKDVRIYSAAMLAATGDLGYVSIIREGLAASDKTIRGACVNVLSNLADEESYKRLKYISKNDDDELIRQVAFRGVLLIESKKKEKK